jgi:hypothetical protein
MKKEEILNLLNKLTKKEKDILNDILSICSEINSYKMILKSIHFDKDKNTEDYKMSLKVKENYEKKLKEKYCRLIKVSKNIYNKILEGFSFKNTKLKDLNESLDYIKEFLLK